jgi:hypothetical protein
MHIAIIGAKREMRTLQRPPHCSGGIGHTQVAQLVDLGVACIPEVDARGEADGQEVLCGPIYEIEVVVILESRGIEYLDGYFIDPAFLSAIFCIFGELVVVVFLDGLLLGVVAPVAELENVVVFKGLDGRLLPPWW